MPVAPSTRCRHQSSRLRRRLQGRQPAVKFQATLHGLPPIHESPMLFRGGIRTRELPASSDLEMDLDDDTNMSDDQTRSAHSAGTVDSDGSWSGV